MRGYLFIVPSKYWIGGCQNRGPCIQCTSDAGFGDGHCLLLHNLVDRRPVSLVHFVKFIYTTDAHVRQNQGPAFKAEFISHLISHHRRCETHAWRPFASCVDSSWHDHRYVLEKLRLRDSWVSLLILIYFNYILLWGRY